MTQECQVEIDRRIEERKNENDKSNY